MRVLQGVVTQRDPPLRAEVAAPADLDVVVLRHGTDEYAVLSFGVQPQSPSEDVAAHCLTAAERSIAELVLGGHTNTAIARARGTSVRTVANQVTALYRKLGVASRRELRVRLRGAP